MDMNAVEFVAYVPGGVKVIHNACGFRFCISHHEAFTDGIECPDCGQIVTYPEGADWK